MLLILAEYFFAGVPKFDDKTVYNKFIIIMLKPLKLKNNFYQEFLLIIICIM